MSRRLRIVAVVFLAVLCAVFASWSAYERARFRQMYRTHAEEADAYVDYLIYRAQREARLELEARTFRVPGRANAAESFAIADLNVIIETNSPPINRNVAVFDKAFLWHKLHAAFHLIKSRYGTPASDRFLRFMVKQGVVTEQERGGIETALFLDTAP